MQIIIVGCGKVGRTLVSQLSEEKHNITVVDVNPQNVRNVSIMYDVMGVVGNGTSYEVLMVLAHSNSRIARILRWPGLQMQRLTTREPDESMLECAIVSVNVVLYGLPEHAEKTPEGWAILRSYRESEQGYVPPVQEAAETEEPDGEQDAPETEKAGA